MIRLSIGWRLTVWYLAIFALGQFVFGAGMWLVLRHHLISLVDENLHHQTDDLRSFLMLQKKKADVPKFQEEVTETYAQDYSGEYLAISTSTGDPIYVSDFLKKNAFAAPVPAPGAGSPAAVAFEDRVIGGKELRFFRSNVNTHGLTFVIAMGGSTKEVWDTLRAFRNYLLLFAPLVLLTSAAGGYWLSHRALAPVDALTRTARNISGQNLHSRLEKLETGDELQRLSDTLNEMLDRIEKVFKRITQFTADASHELRTPISLMRTEAELALRKERDADAYREALQHILSETETMSVLIEDLLALARADSGRELLKPKPVELGEFLLNSTREWKPLAARAGLELNSDTRDAGQVWVMADESALRRVLTILLDNALKYTPAPGRIDIFLDERDGCGVISVNDTGIGISAAEQPKIFERFYRVDKVRGRDVGGAGLGLAIARWIVERHGGSIIVESSVDRGSKFSVQMPALSRSSVPTMKGVVQG
jgi:two-component system, OmpR family, heavy metal sensor histidine kinase CusS